MLAPIMPKPTIHHGDCLPARKKVSLSVSRPESRETKYNTPNQPKRVARRRMDIVDITPAKIRIICLKRLAARPKGWNRCSKWRGICLDICLNIGLMCDRIALIILMHFLQPTKKCRDRWQKRFAETQNKDLRSGNKDNLYRNRDRKNCLYCRKSLKHNKRGSQRGLFLFLTSKITTIRVAKKDKKMAGRGIADCELLSDASLFCPQDLLNQD